MEYNVKVDNNGNTFYGGQSNSKYHTYSNGRNRRDSLELYHTVDIYDNFRLTKPQYIKENDKRKCCIIL